MSPVDLERNEWSERIRQKTRQIREAWHYQFGEDIPLEDALVAVFADCSFNREIPRVIVRDSEGASRAGLVQVLGKIWGTMKTPTYDTLNFSSPEAVEFAKRLCLTDSFTCGNCPKRDASYVLGSLIGEWPTVYWDRARDLPHYSGEISLQLHQQFGPIRVRIALTQHKDFSKILGECETIGDVWQCRADATDEERIPYQIAQYGLRGVPLRLAGKSSDTKHEN